MYKRKIPLDIDCSVKISMKVIGGKWKTYILYELNKGSRRPSDLHRLFTDASTCYKSAAERIGIIWDDRENGVPRASSTCGIFNN